ncbi:MAG: hypothetical protein AB7N71_13215, partial [Phycisphaerae bacterium]
MRTKLLVGTLVCAAVASGTYMFTGCIPGIDISNVFAASLDASGIVRIGSAKTDIIDALAKDYGESDGDKLSDLSDADLAKIIVDAKMVVADLSELTVDQIAANPLFKAALAGGVPVLLDNVTDSAKMA